MSINKKFSDQINYVTPAVEVIEIPMQCSVLAMSNEETTQEDLF